MVADIDVRAALLGRDSAAARRTLAAAVGLLVLSGAATLLVRTVDYPLDGRTNFVLVAIAGLFAGWSAYRNSGLLVSVALVLAVVGGVLGSDVLVGGADRVAPVALPLSFRGRGAAEFWLPAACFVGTVAFGVGVAVRWVANALTGGW